MNFEAFFRGLGPIGRMWFDVLLLAGIAACLWGYLKLVSFSIRRIIALVRSVPDNSGWTPPQPMPPSRQFSQKDDQ